MHTVYDQNFTANELDLTHATLNFTENKGRAPELISMIDETRNAGADISLDTYPYLPGCTTLASLLPSWASSGGPVETLKRLEDPEMREKIRVAVEVKGCDGGHGIPTNWAEIQVSTGFCEVPYVDLCHKRSTTNNPLQIGSPTHPSLLSYSGRRVDEVARSKNTPPIEVFFDILRKDRLATSCLMHMGNEENVRAIMQHPTHCSGSDAILCGELLHPRAYGTFPRYLGESVFFC